MELSFIAQKIVHLRREDVAQLFHDELGIPYTTDIPILTETARQTLRQVFLEADIGISGVNFGVAESGSLCLLTNEGNGRMVTTLPSAHIAVMGMERLLPNMGDLALMLSLLPRSATTQKITVYTQFIQNPLPNQERHLIYLDNGRSNLRKTPLNDSLFCIRCGACLNACPVFREIGGHAYASVYPGPIGSVISAGLFGAAHAPLAQACTICGACKEACPVDIDLPKMLLRVRAGEFPQAEEKGAGLPFLLKFGLTAFRRFALRPGLFAVSQKLMGKVASTIKSDYIHLPAWTGWGYGKDFPRPAEKPFREKWKSRKQGLGIRNQELGIRNQELGNRESGKTTPNTQSLITLFSEELIALGAEIIPISAAELPDRLITYLRERGITRVQTDAASAKHVQSREIAVQTEADPNIAIGITKAIAAVAETGSILVKNENRDTGSASLLPEIHIAILQACDLYEKLEEVLNMPEIAGTAAASLISQPPQKDPLTEVGLFGVRLFCVFLGYFFLMEFHCLVTNFFSA
ncbi:MAG: hypothetical protein B6I38_06825 [Anaerolineaceae bacterium 4572_5.1]|nr:MAG: hypothetical protein B6I38_06825 [Anaerolineaceae bacterium 4572_5.1]